jgi:exosortase/archaeosortase family protein
MLQSMTVMAVAWSGLAVRWFFPPNRIPRSRLCVICAGAFPWVLLDFNTLGWMFRLSGATVTAVFFESLGFDVEVSGTQLTVGGLPISVEAACGGLQLLQVLLSGGALLSLLHFPTASGFWWMLLSLPMLAWISNTLRIIAISAWGLVFGMESAAGAFHTWGALLVLACMLLLLLGSVNIIAQLNAKGGNDSI